MGCIQARKSHKVPEAQLELQRQNLQEARNEYAKTYLSLMTGLWHLKRSDKKAREHNDRFHVDENGQGCPCCQCKPERWVELPKMNERDTFLDSHETMADQTDSFFYRLPTELKCQIFKLMFTGFVTFRDHHWRNLARPNDLWMKLISPQITKSRQVYRGEHSALLRTCRRIYAEALHLFYSENLFFFDPSMTQITACYRPNWLSTLRHIFILGKPNQPDLDFLQLMPNLWSLVLIHPQFEFWHYGPAEELSVWRDHGSGLQMPMDLGAMTARTRSWGRQSNRCAPIPLPPLFVTVRDRYQIVLPYMPHDEELDGRNCEIVYAPALTAFTAQFCRLLS